MKTRKTFAWFATLVLTVTLVGAVPAAAAPKEGQANLPAFQPPTPKFTTPAAFDVSPSLSDLVATSDSVQRATAKSSEDVLEVRPDRGPTPAADNGFTGDGATQLDSQLRTSEANAPSTASAPTIPSPSVSFEGLSNQDNFNIFGFRVNPPDPVGDVGRNHYVEMVNLAFAVYSKTGTLLLGPADIGSLWAGFAIPDCTDASGDPIVVYDQIERRWLLSQFTTRGFDGVSPNYNCIAVSVSDDPTGAYFRYAFITQPDTVDGGFFFPDYPKYGVWKDSYILTTRDFGNGLTTFEYGISVYALEQDKILAGKPNARAVQFFLDSNVVPLELIGDGLLPPDIDGNREPKKDAPAPIVGTQDDGAGYGATFDALNIWELKVEWKSTPVASLILKTQLPVASFDSIFPCGVVAGDPPPNAPNSRDCLPQPGVNGSRYLDILSYRQRPIWRLAYRNFKTYEALVTNQSVEAAPGLGGTRWYEIRRVGGTYSIYQQGTVAGTDGIHRWMGSIAQDKKGNMALGYSVVSGTTFPGIRYTGRRAGDPLGLMTLGEAVLINGTGVQTTVNSRWGDYTSMNVDPRDDCKFWYVNEYYTAAGQASSVAGWQTRIGSFKLPGCN